MGSTLRWWRPGTYTFRVTAIKADGVEHHSNEVQFVDSRQTAPTSAYTVDQWAATDVRAAGTSEQGLSISWLHPADVAGWTIDKFVVEYRIAGATTNTGSREYFASGENVATIGCLSNPSIRCVPAHILSVAEAGHYTVRVVTHRSKTGETTTTSPTAWSDYVEIVSTGQFRVWFIDNTPNPNPNIGTGRVFMMVDTNRANASATCFILGGQINCPPRTLVSLGVSPGQSRDISVRATAGTQNTAISGDNVIKLEYPSEGRLPATSYDSLAKNGDLHGPGPVEFTASGGSGKLAVSWYKSFKASAVGDIDGYAVQYKLSSATTWTNVIKGVDDREHVITGLADGMYNVRVRAQSSGVDADAPATYTPFKRYGMYYQRNVDVAATNTAVPDPATGTFVAYGDRSLTIDWAAPDASVHYYTLRYRQVGTEEWTTLTAHDLTGIPICTRDESANDHPQSCQSDRRVVITGLKPAARYAVEINAHNANGSSGFNLISGAHGILPVVNAATVKFVGNITKTYSAGLVSSFERYRAQAFTTGSHAGGYKLHEVKLKISRGTGSTFDPNAKITVKIQARGSNDRPDPAALSVTLTSPSTLFEGDNTFRASDGIDLDPSTKYFVVLEFPQVNINAHYHRTNVDGEDPGKKAGWSVGINSFWYDPATETPWSNVSSAALMITIEGYEK